MTDFEEMIKGSSLDFKFQLLSRMKMDCNYFLGAGHRHAKCLWAEDVKTQLKYMRYIWESLPKNQKPEWLTLDDITRYERLMTSK